MINFNFKKSTPFPFKNREIFFSWMEDRKLDFYVFFEKTYNVSKTYRYLFTGFTGSTGLLLLEKASKKAFLFLDSRYHLQASQEVNEEELTVFRIQSGNSINYEWIAFFINLLENKKKNTTIAFNADEWLYMELHFFLKTIRKRSLSSFVCLRFPKKIPKFFEEKNSHAQDFFDRKRLEIKKLNNPIHKLSIEYLEKEKIGFSFLEKYLEIQKFLKEEKLDSIFITEKDLLSYFLCLRSYEESYFSSLNGFAFFSAHDISETMIFLNDEHYKLLDFSDLNFFIKDNNLENFIFFSEKDFIYQFNFYLNGKLLSKKEEKFIITLDREKVNLALLMKLKKIKSIKVKYQNLEKLSGIKLQKNKNEISLIKEAYKKTGEAYCKLVQWARKNVLDEHNDITEKDLKEKLEGFLFELGANNLSFPSIVASKENAAIIHYTNMEEKKSLKKGDLILIDVGAYFEGGYASDLSRTFVLENDYDQVNKEYRKIYSMLLKAAIAPMLRIFPENVLASCIDLSARSLLWEEGFDFGHSLGHGIGIDVHESPLTISTHSKQCIKSSMIFTIEPGVYASELYGMRIENAVLSVLYEKKISIGIRKFLKLEIISYVPFDKLLMDQESFNMEEKKFLENYRKNFDMDEI